MLSIDSLLILIQEKLNEDVIDYDLLEDLIIHIDEEGEAGAVLVFLPVRFECLLVIRIISKVPQMELNLGFGASLKALLLKARCSIFVWELNFEVRWNSLGLLFLFKDYEDLIHRTGHLKLWIRLCKIAWPTDPNITS